MRSVGKIYKYPVDSQQRKYKPGVLLLLFCAATVIFFVPFIIKLLTLGRFPGSVVPPEFNLASIVIITASRLLHCSKTMIKKDNIRGLRFYLCGALIIGLLFIFLQHRGWKELYLSFISPEAKIIMVMVAVHAIYFMGALLILVSLLVSLFKIRSRAEIYIYFLNDKRSTAFRSNYFYWDFLCILWIIMYFMMICKSI